MTDTMAPTTVVSGTAGGAGAPAALVRYGGGVLVSALIGVVLGGCTDAGQTWLPWAASSMANSGGSWALVAFVVALAAGGIGRAAVWGTTSMVGLVVGYYLTAALRGVEVPGPAVRFWVVAALVVGPVVGLAAGWVRRGSPARVAVGAGILGGLMIGESVHGLRYVSEWTSSAYWWLQAVGGLGLMVGLLAWRARRTSAGAVTVVTAAVVGAATVGAYLRYM